MHARTPSGGLASVLESARQAGDENEATRVSEKFIPASRLQFSQKRQQLTRCDLHKNFFFFHLVVELMQWRKMVKTFFSSQSCFPLATAVVGGIICFGVVCLSHFCECDISGAP